ncbi:hypothetical protein J3458_020727 [Metarhizium acridum]|uniref:uncharacterized protein n=1 Tax=Metarhizium acridum TaxID=92637 RepID=UPI001C6B490B|nr:hypothetical protein J3458_020727 [Metarhizium acridum]
MKNVKAASCRNPHCQSAASVPFARRSSTSATDVSRTSSNSDYFQAQTSNGSREPIISHATSEPTTFSLYSSLGQTTPTTTIYLSRTNAIHSSRIPDKQKASSISPPHPHPVATPIRKQPNLQRTDQQPPKYQTKALQPPTRSSDQEKKDHQPSSK